MTQKQSAYVLAIWLMLLPLFVAAQSVPLSMNYQGKLNDSNGNPVTGVVSIQFRIYDVPTGGNPLWTETFSMVSVNQGIFSVLLGSSVPIDASILSGSPRYLEVRVESDPPMTPRQQIVSAAFAIQAGNAVQSANSLALDGIAAVNWQRRVTQSCPAGSSISSISDTGTVTCETDDGGVTSETDPQVGTITTDGVPRWDGSALVTGAMSDTGTNVGVGTAAPVAKLQVVGEVRTTDATNNPRLWGQGRAGSPRYGTVGPEQGLCTNGNITFGLSWAAVQWSGAAAACPPGTWVCTAAERGEGACDTARPDTSTDYVQCNGVFDDFLPGEHYGWLAGIATGQGYEAQAKSELANAAQTLRGCLLMPVWCCSE